MDNFLLCAHRVNIAEWPMLNHPTVVDQPYVKHTGVMVQRFDEVKVPSRFPKLLNPACSRNVSSTWPSEVCQCDFLQIGSPENEDTTGKSPLCKRKSSSKPSFSISSFPSFRGVYLWNYWHLTLESWGWPRWLIEEIPKANHLGCFWNPVNDEIFIISTG